MLVVLGIIIFIALPSVTACVVAGLGGTVGAMWYVALRVVLVQCVLFLLYLLYLLYCLVQSFKYLTMLSI